MPKKASGTRYVEPADYFPVEIRRELKLGEFAENKKTAKPAQNNSTVKKTVPKKSK